MKKVLLPTLALLVAFFLVAGCKKKTPAEADPDPTRTPIPTVVIDIPTHTVTVTFTFSPTPFNRVFVSDANTKGGFGGLAGANALCQAYADAVPLGGTWKAWISTSGVDAKDNIADVGPWYLIDQGTFIANDIADLTDGSISNQIDRTETYTWEPNLSVYTGTNVDGTAAVDTCTDWTLDTGSATFGSTGASDFGWTNSVTAAFCSLFSRLYCFEQ